MQNKISQDTATSPTVGAEERVGSSLPNWLFPIVCVWGCVYPFVGERLVTACNEVIYPAPHGKMFPPPEYLEAVVRAMTVNTAIGYGVCGSLFFLVLAAMVGAASGIAHAMRGAVIGAVLGFLIPGAAGGIGHRIENYLLQADMDGILRTVLVLSAEFIAFALTAGLVWKLVGRQVTVGRVLGASVKVAFVALISFILIAAIGIPNGWIEGMHPNEMNVRYLLFFCLTLSAVGTVGLLLRGERKAAIPPAAS